MADATLSAGIPACKFHVPTSAGTGPQQDSSSTREKVIPYIRRKGVVGDLTDAFINDINWAVRGRALVRALAFTTCYPSNAEGAQAYIDELLALDVESAAAAPAGSNIVILSNWMERFRQEILSGEEEASA